VKRKANSTEEVLYVIVHKKIQLQSQPQLLQNNNPSKKKKKRKWKKKITEDQI
jgi:hypothetical protein